MNKSLVFVFLVYLLAFSTLYIINIDSWLMHDDEGTDFYEVWRLQLGEKPGINYAAEQQPLFLIVGSTLVGLFGRSPLPLRLLSLIQVVMCVFWRKRSPFPDDADRSIRCLSATWKRDDAG